jgi:hypothetical protein
MDSINPVHLVSYSIMDKENLPKLRCFGNYTAFLITNLTHSDFFQCQMSSHDEQANFPSLSTLVTSWRKFKQKQQYDQKHHL